MYVRIEVGRVKSGHSLFGTELVVWPTILILTKRNLRPSASSLNGPFRQWENGPTPRWGGGSSFRNIINTTMLASEERSDGWCRWCSMPYYTQTHTISQRRRGCCICMAKAAPPPPPPCQILHKKNTRAPNAQTKIKGTSIKLHLLNTHRRQGKSDGGAEMGGGVTWRSADGPLSRS